jgi:di/tricarboxylate transporter
VTLIGTPPNIIIAKFRAEATGEPFAMFDFAAVGLPVALVGLAFISFVGWRLLPRQETAGAQNEDRFHINRYVSQATLLANSDLVGQTVREIENLCGNEVTVIAIIRGRRRMLAPAGNTGFEADDILLLEVDTVALQPLFDATGLVHVGAELVDPNELETGQVRMVEVVVMPGSAIEGSSMRGLKMHEYFGVNLLAMSREGGGTDHSPW